jgi:hypothetical protein
MPPQVHERLLVEFGECLAQVLCPSRAIQTAELLKGRSAQLQEIRESFSSWAASFRLRTPWGRKILTCPNRRVPATPQIHAWGLTVQPNGLEIGLCSALHPDYGDKPGVRAGSGPELKYARETI